MAVIDAADIIELTATILKAPGPLFWTRYEAGADVLYVNFEKPAVATDSILSDDDIIIRYRGDVVIGFTVVHASTRKAGA